MLISNMAKVPVQENPNKVFWVPNTKAFSFCMKFCNLANDQGFSFKYDEKFSNFSSKIPKTRHYLSQPLHFDKTKNADLKHDKSFFQTST